MKAIRTHYIGPTNHKPARIVATDEDGNKITRTYDYGETQAEHAAAALALCTKMKWTGTLIAGGLHGGYVFVFLDRQNTYPIDPTKPAISVRIRV